MQQQLVYLSFIAITVAGSALRAQDELIFESVTKAPQSRVLPGGVLVLKASATNKGETTREGTIVATVEGYPEVQCARRVAIEPGHMEMFDVYLQLPESIRDQEAIELQCTMNVRYGNREVLLTRKGLPVMHTLRLPVQRLRTLAAIALNAEPPEVLRWHWPPKKPYASYEMVVAARVDSGNERQTADFEAQSLPLNLSDWAAVDVLAIADPSVFSDAAGVEAIRRFLDGGGRVWIMLDRVSCELIRPLLGMGQVCEQVDQVALNEFTVDVANQSHRLLAADRTVTSTEPIVMTRVLQSGGAVTHTVRGWPAAIKMNVGYGELLLTTLDSQAWIEPRTEQESRDARYQSNYAMKPYGIQLAQDVNAERLPRPLMHEVEYPLELIGNPIVPRSWVTLVLVGFCGLLVCAGAWRAVGGDLSMLGLIAPLMAVLASGALLFSATWIRRDIPQSVSKLQLVEVGEGGTFGLVREQAAAYLSATQSMTLRSNGDGQARARESLSGGIRRFMVEDFQQWQLSNEAWPAGSWRYDADYVLPSQGLVVEARLTERGVHLDLPQGLPSTIQDPVLQFTVGDPMLCAQSRTGLEVDGSITVDGDRWIASSLISDEQSRRLTIFREYFDSERNVKRRQRAFYGWTEVWDGPHWNQDLSQNGSALVALPVHLQRPPTATDIYVPHGLVRVQRTLDELGNTAAYNEKSGKWTSGMSMSANARLEFVLPPEVVPFAAKSIELELDIKAPQRTVIVSAQTSAGSIELANLNGPSLPWTKTVTDPAVLAEARDGVLDLVLQISDRTDIELASQLTSVVTWQIDHFHASFRGQVLPRGLSD